MHEEGSWLCTFAHYVLREKRRCCGYSAASEGAITEITLPLLRCSPCTLLILGMHRTVQCPVALCVAVLST
jgi:hypothetical protein